MYWSLLILVNVVTNGMLLLGNLMVNGILL